MTYLASRTRKFAISKSPALRLLYQATEDNFQTVRIDITPQFLSAAFTASIASACFCSMYHIT